MVDLHGKDRGNISLPPRLHPPDIWDNDLDDDEYKILIMNMQKAIYDVRIEDILKRITRLESRNTELLETYEATILIRSHVDTETSDQIAQLNRQLFAETNKMEEYKKRAEMVQKWRREEKQAHIKSVDICNRKYAKTHLAFTSDIKALNAKINTLEDYKLTRNGLRDKLQTGDDLMAEREKEAKQQLEQINRKLKIDRRNLKNEMYQRLLGLAGTFQSEVVGCITKPIHRLMRENIILKNEMIQIVEESLAKKKGRLNRQEAKSKYKVQIKDGRMDTVQSLITGKIQGLLLKTVKDQHLALEKRLSLFGVTPCKAKRKEAILLKPKDEIPDCELRVRKLEVLLHREQAKLGLAKFLKNKSVAEVKRYTETLYNVKYAVACALKMMGVGEDIPELENSKVISNLLDILQQNSTQKWTAKTLSVETLATSNDAYVIGDLGFEPERIDVDFKTAASERKPSELNSFASVKALDARLSTESSIHGDSRVSDISMIIGTEYLNYAVEVDDNSEESLRSTNLKLDKQGEEEKQEEKEEAEEPERDRYDEGIENYDGEEEFPSSNEELLAENN